MVVQIPVPTMIHMPKLHIFDTTLRDGEQSPGCSMTLTEKLEMALQLERLGVDVIEAGFAIASPGDFAAISAIAARVKNAKVASLARATRQDIDVAVDAIKHGASPRLHTFIATSPIHMAHKLKMSPEAVLTQASDMVRYAKKSLSDIEFSAEDATRSDPAFLGKLIDAVIEAGATVINIPDTVGYTTPDEFYNFLINLQSYSKLMHRITLSVHCHNDLGLAVANSLAAVKAGARQVECTINGIGERAGNAALEEIVMGLVTRSDRYGVQCDIQTKELTKTSKLLTSITGVAVQPNKAIVGANAFAHESGIHQHGMLAHPSTYEIMPPASVGLNATHMVLGKHSGRHGFEDKVKKMGFTLTPKELDDAFQSFKHLADKKKTVYDEDLEALLLRKTLLPDSETLSLETFVINSGTAIEATANIGIRLADGRCLSSVAIGDGPVDACFKALDRLMQTHQLHEHPYALEDYTIRAITEGNDALGESIVKVRHKQRLWTGIGVSTDIVEASLLAYVNALNKFIS